MANFMQHFRKFLGGSFICWGNCKFECAYLSFVLFTSRTGISLLKYRTYAPPTTDCSWHNVSTNLNWNIGSYFRFLMYNVIYIKPDNINTIFFTSLICSDCCSSFSVIWFYYNLSFSIVTFHPEWVILWVNVKSRLVRYEPFTFFFFFFFFFCKYRQCCHSCFSH